MNIYKYQLPDSPSVLELKENINGFDPLCVQVQHGHPMLWAEVAPDESRTLTIRIAAVMTGQKAPHDSIYLGTALLEGDSFVLHYYQLTK